MCGIAGIYNYQPLGLDIQSKLEEMGTCIKHRGPDDESYYYDNEIAVAFRRLSIIDVEGGRQPSMNETKNIICFMNGEIVNYVELRKHLENRGHFFHSHSDNEILPHLYEEYGERFVEHLVGMYAILLWDKAEKKLLIVRDRFGIKPLFYAFFDDSILFASEIKSILASDVIRPEVNIDARNMAFHTHFVVAPDTMFKHIAALEPGFILIVNNGNVRKKRYYYLSEEIQKRETVPSEQIEDKIYSEIDAIMKMWMRSDVPLGISQSGGIDSSILMHHASHYADRIYSITVDFQAQEYFPDELNFAKIMAKQINADHKIITVGCSRLLDSLPAAMWVNDNINLASAYINHFFVAQEASKYVKVLLTGAAGDELFIGYPWYQFKAVEKVFYSLPYLLKILLLRLFKPLTLLKGNFPIAFDWFYAWSDFVNTYPKKHIYRTRLLYPFQINNIFNDNYSGDHVESIYSDFIKEIFNGDILNALTYADLFTLIAAHQMTQSDSAGMAHSIENRPPLLDHRLVELVLSIPSRFKTGDVMEKKYVLKQIYRNTIPREILYGKKVGFSSPLHTWVNERFKDTARRFLKKESGALEAANKEYILYFVDNCDKNWKYAELVYGIISYATWYKLHIEMRQKIMPDVTLEELWDI